MARYGTYVTTPDLEDEYAKGRAKVHVETKVENETESEAGVKVRTTILDDAGNVFCEAVTTEEIAVSAGETETFSQDIVNREAGTLGYGDTGSVQRENRSDRRR